MHRSIAALRGRCNVDVFGGSGKLILKGVARRCSNPRRWQRRQLKRREPSMAGSDHSFEGICRGPVRFAVTTRADHPIVGIEERPFDVATRVRHRINQNAQGGHGAAILLDPRDGFAKAIRRSATPRRAIHCRWWRV